MEALLILAGLAWLASPFVLFAMVRVERSHRMRHDAELDGAVDRLQARVRDLEARLEEGERPAPPAERAPAPAVAERPYHFAEPIPAPVEPAKP